MLIPPVPALLLSAALAASALAPSAGAQERRPVQPFLAAVPEDALVVLATGELDRVRARVERNAWWRMLGGEELEPARRMLASFLETVCEERGVDPLEVARSIHGRAAFFYGQDDPILDWGGLVVEPGEERETFDGFVERLSGAFEADGRVETTVRETAQGERVEMRVHTDEGGGPTTVLVELADLTVLAFAAERERAISISGGIVDRVSGTDASAGLLASERFTAARASTRVKDGALEVYLDLDHLLRLVARADRDLAEALPVLEAIGFTGMEWAYLAADAGEGARLDLEIAIDAPSSGLLRALLARFPAAERELAAWVPREAVGFGIGAFDVWGAWRDVWSFLEREYPDVHAAGRLGLETAMQPMGVDLEEDLLAQLTGRFASFTLPVPEEEWRTTAAAELGALAATDEAGLVPQGDGFAIGLRDAEVVELALLDLADEALGGSGARIESGEHLGTPIHGIGGAVHWAFAGDRLVVSQFLSVVRAAVTVAVDEDAPSVLENETLAAPLGGLLPASSASVYDTVETVRSLLGLASTFVPLFEIAGGTASGLGASVPPPELAERYLSGVLTSAVRVRPEAITLTWSAR